MLYVMWLIIGVCVNALPSIPAIQQYLVSHLPILANQIHVDYKQCVNWTMVILSAIVQRVLQETHLKVAVSCTQNIFGINKFHI